MTQKLEQDGKCDAACKQKAQMVKAQMEALRKEINADYHSMTHFGDKAGYVPPPRSIRSPRNTQVTWETPGTRASSASVSSSGSSRSARPWTSPTAQIRWSV